jgi:hypothetical protein
MLRFTFCSLLIQCHGLADTKKGYSLAASRFAMATPQQDATSPQIIAMATVDSAGQPVFQVSNAHSSTAAAVQDQQTANMAAGVAANAANTAIVAANGAVAAAHTASRAANSAVAVAVDPSAQTQTEATYAANNAIAAANKAVSAATSAQVAAHMAANVHATASTAAAGATLSTAAGQPVFEVSSVHSSTAAAVQDQQTANTAADVAANAANTAIVAANGAAAAADTASRAANSAVAVAVGSSAQTQTESTYAANNAIAAANKAVSAAASAQKPANVVANANVHATASTAAAGAALSTESVMRSEKDVPVLESQHIQLIPPSSSWAYIFTGLSLAMIVKTLCVVSNVLVQVSPFPTVTKWDARGCTGDSDAAPYVAIAFGGFQWCFYGIFAWLVTAKSGFLILVQSNCLGAILGSYYVVSFLRNCRSEDARATLHKYISAVAALAALQLCALSVLSGQQALMLIGVTSSFCSFVNATSVLATVPQVLRTRDSSSIPGNYVLATLGSSLIWALCGCIIGDPCVTVPNIFSVGCSGTSLALKFVYPSSEDKKSLKAEGGMKRETAAILKEFQIGEPHQIGEQQDSSPQESVSLSESSRVIQVVS